MRLFIWFALASMILPISGFGRTSKKTSIFTSSNGDFRFAYPSDFQVCVRGKTDPCRQSIIPVCQPDALVCVIYPEAEFKDTSFGTAAFEVREVSSQQEMMTADVCVTPFPRKDSGIVSNWPEFLISAAHPVEIIGDIEFVHGSDAGVAAGHSSSVDLYRTFRNQRCFELRVTEAETDPNVAEPPLKTLTLAQWKKFDRTMSDILHSFRFDH